MFPIVKIRPAGRFYHNTFLYYNESSKPLLFQGPNQVVIDENIMWFRIRKVHTNIGPVEPAKVTRLCDFLTIQKQKCLVLNFFGKSGSDNKLIYITPFEAKVTEPNSWRMSRSKFHECQPWKAQPQDISASRFSFSLIQNVQICNVWF